MTEKQDTHKIKKDGSTWCGINWFAHQEIPITYRWNQVTCEDCITAKMVKECRPMPKSTTPYLDDYEFIMEVLESQQKEN